jgi:isocitrate dehydrogenase
VGTRGELQDAKAVIPDSATPRCTPRRSTTAASNGAFDPATMGTTPNVGLMAQKAEEYGSHDKTFEIEAPGTSGSSTRAGATLLEHEVEPGDIWRAARPRTPVADWVRSPSSAPARTGAPARVLARRVPRRTTPRCSKVARQLASTTRTACRSRSCPVREATRLTLERVAPGEDTISVTGNVLRDYLTDLFPILELGTSAEDALGGRRSSRRRALRDGAGGSAPKHVQQLLKEEPPPLGQRSGSSWRSR